LPARGRWFEALPSLACIVAVYDRFEEIPAPGAAVIVETVHPTAVVHVPARSRNERTDVVRMRSAMAIRVLPADAMEPIVSHLETMAESRGTIHSHEGALWQRLGDSSVRGAPPLDGDGLRAVLEGRAGSFELTRRFSGTPLVARLRSLSLGHFDIRPFLDRLGNEIDLDASRSISKDTRPVAAAALQALLDRDLRIAGDVVFSRLSPLLAARPGCSSQGGDLLLHFSGHLTNYPTLVASRGNEAGMMAAVRAIEGPDAPTPTTYPGVREWREVPFGDSLEGDDHRLVANSHPGAIRRLLDSAMAEPSRHADRDALRAARERMHALEVEATTGLAGLGDPAAALLSIAGAIRTVMEGPRHAYASRPGYDMLREAIETHYFPSIPVPDLPDGDVEALGHAR
jgi:hypothetical protein